MGERTGNPVGRPSEYRPEFCEKVVVLGEKGYSKAMIAGELGVVRMTLDVWCKEWPLFNDAMDRAREASLSWWEAQGNAGIWSREFNANAYRLQVLNRFPADWRERTEISGPGGGPIETTTVDASALATALLGVLAKAGAGDDTKKE